MYRNKTKYLKSTQIFFFELHKIVFVKFVILYVFLFTVAISQFFPCNFSKNNLPKNYQHPIYYQQLPLMLEILKSCTQTKKRKKITH